MRYKFSDVNQGLELLLQRFNRESVAHAKGELLDQPGRGGTRVKSLDEPVALTFENPRQRVVFNEARDANPFYHLYEALWMLAGRNDVEPLGYFEKIIPEFSDDGRTLNGAYGYRWKHAKRQETYDPRDGSYEPVDQLKLLIQHLRNHPYSRRAVLSMWNVEDDLLKINIPNISKDVCCNLSCKFRIMPKTCDHCKGERGVEIDTGGMNPDGSFISDHAYCEICNGEGSVPHKLDMIVYNRANDLTWGCLGANYVHFTILQEYMASLLGLKLGRYHVMSGDLHMFYQRDDVEGMMDWYGTDNRNMWSRDKFSYQPRHKFTVLNPTPLITDKDKPLNTADGHLDFIDQLIRIVDWSWKISQLNTRELREIFEPVTFKFFTRVCLPMFFSFARHKKGETLNAIQDLRTIMKTNPGYYGQDWLQAGVQWLERSHKKSIDKDIADAKARKKS